MRVGSVFNRDIVRSECGSSDALLDFIGSAAVVFIGLVRKEK